MRYLLAALGGVATFFGALMAWNNYSALMSMGVWDQIVCAQACRDVYMGRVWTGLAFLAVGLVVLALMLWPRRTAGSSDD